VIDLLVRLLVRILATNLELEHFGGNIFDMYFLNILLEHTLYSSGM